MEHYNKMLDRDEYDAKAQKVFSRTFQQTTTHIMKIRALEGILDNWLRLYMEVRIHRNSEIGFCRTLQQRTTKRYWKIRWGLQRLDDLELFLVEHLCGEDGDHMNTFLIFLNTYGCNLDLDRGNSKGQDVVRKILSTHPRKVHEFSHLRGLNAILRALSLL